MYRSSAQDGEALARSVGSAKNTIIIGLNAKGEISSWNEGARRLVGYEEVEIIGAPVDVLFTEEDRQRDAPKTLLEQARVHGAVAREGWRVVKTGESIWTSGEAIALADPAGSGVGGYLKIIHPCLAYETAEAERVRLVERFQHVARLGGMGVFIIDARSRWPRLYGNILSLLGLSGDRVYRIDAIERQLNLTCAPLPTEAGPAKTPDGRLFAPGTARFFLRGIGGAPSRLIERRAERIGRADQAVLIGVIREVEQPDPIAPDLDLLATLAAVQSVVPGYLWTAELDGTGRLSDELIFDKRKLNQRVSMGDQWVDFIHPDDLTRTVEIFRSALGRGQGFENWIRIRYTDGLYRWAVQHAVPILSGTKVTRWIGALHDQQNLRTITDRFHAVQEQVGRGVLTGLSSALAPEQTAPSWLPASPAWSPGRAAGPIGKPDASTPPEVLPASATEPRGLEGFPESALDLPAAGFRDEAPLSEPVYGEIAALLHSPVWRLSPEPMALLDAGGMILNFNQAWQEQFHWRRNLVYGTALSDQVIEGQRERIRHRIDYMREHGETHPDNVEFVTLELRCEAEQYRQVLVAFSRWNGHFFARTHSLYGGRDEGPRAHIPGARDRDAAILAERHEALGRLTGGIAHDFNNMLGSVTGALEMLERRIRQNGHVNLERYVSIASAAAKRATALSTRLVALSRMQPINSERVDVNKIVGGMRDLLARSINRDIGIEFDLAPHLPQVECDHSQLENAVLNLALNARDAMPDGGLLRIETRDFPASEKPLTPRLQVGRYVSVAVSDSGTGIPAGILNRIFDPFFTTRLKSGGSGLGLAMVARFARDFGGDVQVESRTGHGSRFVILLPVCHTASGDPDSEPEIQEVPHE